MAPGFERVRNVFGDNFEGHGDVGAALLRRGDPESGVAFGYVVSHIRQDLNDNRAGLLVQAVRACLD